MGKCRYNDGVHVVSKTESGNYILLYCVNCSENVKWVDKNYPLLNRKDLQVVRAIYILMVECCGINWGIEVLRCLNCDKRLREVPNDKKEM